MAFRIRHVAAGQTTFLLTLRGLEVNEVFREIRQIIHSNAIIIFKIILI